MQRVTINQSKGEKQGQGEAKGIKQEGKKERQSDSSDDENPNVVKEGNKRKKKQGQSL